MFSVEMMLLFSTRSVCLALFAIAANIQSSRTIYLTQQCKESIMNIRCRRGSFTRVYIIPLLPSNHKIALKVFTNGSSQRNELFECLREKRLLNEIAKHERYAGKELQIAHVKDDIYGIQCPVLQLEVIDGCDLSFPSKLPSFGMSKLLSFVKMMMNQIGLGVNGTLNQLHAMNIYHNDIKPANIMYSAQKKLFYLIDFGRSIPLSLLHLAEFDDANALTTLQVMSPYHFYLLRQSRQISSTGLVTYRLFNDEATRTMARLSDFYSLGMTALFFVANNCHQNEEDFCFMTKSILAYANSHFSQCYLQNLEAICQQMMPYWRTIQDALLAYDMLQCSKQNQAMMRKLKNWILLNDSYFLNNL